MAASRPCSRSATPDGSTLDTQGNFVTTASHLRAIIQVDPDGKYKVLADKYDGKKFNSPNDIVVGPDGALYFTDPTLDLVKGEKQETPFQGVYRLGKDGSVKLLNSEMAAPNGLAFSPDGKRLYVNDTKQKEIRVWDVAPNGDLKNGRLFGKEEGRGGVPDGMRVDMQGNVYCTGPGGIWVWIQTAINWAPSCSPNPPLTSLGAMRIIEPCTSPPAARSTGLKQKRTVLLGAALRRSEPYELRLLMAFAILISASRRTADRHHPPRCSITSLYRRVERHAQNGRSCCDRGCRTRIPAESGCLRESSQRTCRSSWWRPWSPPTAAPTTARLAPIVIPTRSGVFSKRTGVALTRTVSPPWWRTSREALQREDRYFLTGWEAGGHTSGRCCSNTRSPPRVAPAATNYAGRCLDSGFSNAPRARICHRRVSSGLGARGSPGQFVYLQSQEAMKVARRARLPECLRKVVAISRMVRWPTRVWRSFVDRARER